MNFLSNEVSNVQDYQLEVLGFKDNLLKKYPFVEKGYIFHFYLRDGSIMSWDDPDYQFSIEYNWKLSLPGTLHNLEKTIENFKNKLIQHRQFFIHELDQFGYLYMFIVKSDNMYELIISSDTFGVDTITRIITQNN